MTTPEPGLYEGVDDATYRAWPAFNKSSIPDLNRSPMHWKHTEDNPQQTDAMVMGSLADTILFEPETLDERFALRPDTYESEVTKGRGAEKATTVIEKPWNMNSNTCKRIWAEIQESGKTIISQSAMNRATAIADAVWAHPLAAKWLKTGKPQVSALWVDSKTGVLCKGRLDLLVEPTDDNDAEELAIVDLKVTVNASYNAFRRQMTNLEMYYQAGMYVDAYATHRKGLQPIFYLLAVESEPPHGVAAYPVGPASLATGLTRARLAMLTWKRMKASGKYPGYPVYAEEIDALPWALDKEQDFNG